MARAVYGAGVYPSVSLSIALLVKYMRIIRAVENLLFPPSLAEKLILLWFSICAGSLRSLLACSIHTSGLYSQDFPKSWKCSRERAALQSS